jgi:hypothetical protein
MKDLYANAGLGIQTRMVDAAANGRDKSPVARARGRWSFIRGRIWSSSGLPSHRWAWWCKLWPMRGLGRAIDS